LSAHDDFEAEYLPGLPERLPDGEKLLWQGSPQWKHLARYGFHVVKIAVYFALLALWFVIEAIYDSIAIADVANTLMILLALTGAAVGLLSLLAWASSREAIFTVTNQRLVIRFGVALRMTLNVPFTIIQAIALRERDDSSGIGDIAIELTPENKLSYVVLWPFARPWRLKHPELLLRSVQDAKDVADQLGTHISERAIPSRSSRLAASA
jgi:uncharacterized membrane protein